MILQRILAAVLALGGVAILIALVLLLYGPIPNAQEDLFALGMPGLLLSTLVAILAICIGIPFAIAPRFAARQARKVLF